MKVIWLLILIIPLSAQAGIYQCKDRDGRTVFSDQPCQHGVNKVMPEYETILEPFVSGRATQNKLGFPLRNGLALWNKTNHEMLLILSKLPFSDTEQQQALIHDWSFLERHKATGLGKITLTFVANKIAIKQLRHMRTEFFGFDQEDTAPWSTNHGGNDIIGHVNKLKLDTESKQNWLSFSSQELTPNVRWNINLVLPVREITAPNEQ